MPWIPPFAVALYVWIKQENSSGFESSPMNRFRKAMAGVVSGRFPQPISTSVARCLAIRARDASMFVAQVDSVVVA
jgi:hypothetical protein